MKPLLTLAALMSIAAGSPAAAQDAPSKDCGAISAALEDSGAAWSRGDLDGFMRVYESSPETVYVGGAEPVHGFDAIRAMYAARFGDGAASMGRLSLNVLDCRALGADYALVIGRFSLDGLPRGAAAGQFTLVFHRAAAGWRIISDHSSS
jgi:uncharacterized protein (TIGR02246 family)